MSTSGAGDTNELGIPPACKNMILSLKEIVNGSTETEIYVALKDCNMDPNEAVNRLLSQDHFHEVKSKREKKKVKNTTESRPRGGGGSTSTRGSRTYSGPTHFNSSESSVFQGKSTYKRENGTSSLAISTTPASTVAPRSANWHPPSYSEPLGHENASSTCPSVPQPTSGYQPAWLGGPGQKSMADVVKMGRPQNSNDYTTSNPSQRSINHNIVPEKYPEYDHVSPDNDWPSTDQPQAESGLTSGQSNLSFDRTNEYTGYEINEVEAQDESSSEDQIENHAGLDSMTEPLYDNGPYEHNEVEEVDASLSSTNANVQNLSIQEEEHMVQPEEDAPSLVIPNHLQANTAACSHLTFGSFGANININSVFSRPSSVEHSETKDLEYYEDRLTRNITGAENYELPTSSQTSVLKQEEPEMTHGNQSQYGFPPPHAHTFEVTRVSQSQLSTPFLNDMQAVANGNPVRESDLSYSQFSVSQSMPTRYANSASSISDPTISIAEALKNVGLSSSQPLQQTLATGPAGPQHLPMHPYSQPTLPLGLLGNMVGYSYLPQSYAYMPSGFQQTFAGNNTYHQQLAAMLPQYKNSVADNSLPQSAAVASGYGSFGNPTAIPGNYQVTQPAGPTGSTISYDDLLNARYKDSSHLLSTQQNENSPMWAHGAGSRTMPAVPSSAYYNLQQGQNQQQQQPSGFRQGQQPSQSYGGAVHNYPDFFQSQTRLSQEHQLQQNLRDGGSQGQPKLQSQQLWQNGY
ncbi:hypothetical protein QVD17_20720 [Tagetes erecta]|uniref:GBF-interacting protein 1 N-terminal domain-containing protein n=1 Tax=Tagetes erecta TaxID=13708 RepID=A0AAD8KLQ8_TARER|nr:hypothetical protein QVD17_20720 [Tagetes erecta]